MNSTDPPDDVRDILAQGDAEMLRQRTAEIIREAESAIADVREKQLALAMEERRLGVANRIIAKYSGQTITTGRHWKNYGPAAQRVLLECYTLAAGGPVTVICGETGKIIAQTTPFRIAFEEGQST